MQILNEIIKKTGAVIDHQLPINYKKTGSVNMKGYRVENITFQTLPGVYTTANLYIPDGEGPFPAVINMLGHWQKGKIDLTGPQAVGHSLAASGYVCLTMDPWGAGERGTVHGEFEDHGDGNNLGSSLLNIGEPLIGIQLSENIRGVDLLCSLPYVDPLKIGATGASGGGNQTMYLAAIDKRIRAAVPVVSVGTYEAFIMGSPCICEVLPAGLTFTEESGVLSSIAPRALQICSHKKDNIPAFRPSEMLRSYRNTSPVYEMFGADENIGYHIFDLQHGYMAKDREAMLGWFDLHLRKVGDGSLRKEKPFEQLPEKELMVFLEGERNSNVLSTAEYCRLKGKKLRTIFRNTESFDIHSKRYELNQILGNRSKPEVRELHEFSDKDGWKRFALETSDNKLIPILIQHPRGPSKEYTILCNSKGKGNIEPRLFKEIIESGKGVVIIDFSGTGEVASTSSLHDKDGNLRTISRSLFWLGETLMGEWVKELDLVVGFLNSNFHPEKINVDGSKEAGLAALFLGALGGEIGDIFLRDVPVSYLFDSAEKSDYFSQGVHVPGILKWGDVSLATALSGKEVTFIDPVTMSGRVLNKMELREFKIEFEEVRSLSGKSGSTYFK
jgi:hypothetical protein